MCRIDLCGQIGVWAQKIYESDFMKMRSLKLHLGADSPTRGYIHTIKLQNHLQLKIYYTYRRFIDISDAAIKEYIVVNYLFIYSLYIKQS